MSSVEENHMEVEDRPLTTVPAIAEEPSAITEEENNGETNTLAPETIDSAKNVIAITPLASSTTQVSSEAPISTDTTTIATITSSSVVSATRVYNYGSCEMDQFWLPGERSETRRPYLNSLMENISVAQIACGSLHVLLLTTNGLLYSSGLNDDGALGRPDENAIDQESDKKSKLVQLPVRVDMISAGDSHSVAANSILGVCFQWGAYRNTEKSNLAAPTRIPTQVGAKEFEKKTFAKVLSGTQHSLVLTTKGELFAWGDPDMGVIGRVPRTRHGYEQALKVAKVTPNKVTEVFSAGRHCFLRRTVPTTKKTSWYAWGLNNFGQLGLNLPDEDAPSVVFEPTKLDFFEDLDVVQFCGGESHSLALLSDGTVYGFGRNDIGQFGLGEINSEHPVHGKIKEVNHKPLIIDTLPDQAIKIERIWSGPNYAYARDESGQCFSWGFGANFVLGNRKVDDEDELKPFSIPRDFFKNEEIPTEFSLASQHVTYVFVEGVNKQLTINKELLLNAPVEYLPQHMRPTLTALTQEAKATKILEREVIAKERKEIAKVKEEKVLERAQKTEMKKRQYVEQKEKKVKEEQVRKLDAQATKLEEEAKKLKEFAKKIQEDNIALSTSQKLTDKLIRGRSISTGKKQQTKQQSTKPKGKNDENKSKERSSSKIQKTTVAANKKKALFQSNSNKKKISEAEHVKVSQSKSTKKVKKEPVSYKKK